MKWGILGGTFDPIHIGHLRGAEEIGEAFSLERVIFIPASQPPHKETPQVTSFAQRARMVQLAIVGQPIFSFSDLEGKRAGPSYAVETVGELLSQNRGLELYFIMGQDAFQEIKTWKDWEKLLLSCHTVVMTRPGYQNTAPADVLPPAFACQFLYNEAQNGYQGPTGQTIYFRPVTLLDVSSSELRTRIKAGKSIRYLVPDPVQAYIDAEGCYR
ncbi:MAG: nicotinate-nucleotide adenylyltransferase [Syntrophales bacterium]